MARTKGNVVHSSVARNLRKLGADIAVARRVRRISTTDFAERMGVSRGTLRRLENGDPGVSLNTLAMALVALGTPERLADLMDQASDDIGLLTSRSELPERITSRGRPHVRRSGKLEDMSKDELEDPKELDSKSDKKKGKTSRMWPDSSDPPEGW